MTLLPHLACPSCGAEFDISIFRDASDGHIEDGILTCTECPAWFIIRNGVPRMLPDTLLPENTDFYTRYKHELNAIPHTQKNKKEMLDIFLLLKQKTLSAFGSEWETWDNFGWSGQYASASARRNFDYKVLLTPQELAGKLCLDAGCGNGRYTVVARAYGAEVIGVDISSADTAFKNTRSDEKIHIVQGDLFALPFKKNLFDFAFSNGVLMHTGDARRAFLSIASHLNEKGVITVHLYHKGNVVYEFNDWLLRAIGTHLPLPMMYRIASAGAWIARQFPTLFLQYVVNAFIRLEPHAHYVFDWYTAPIATHHTYPEVYRWLDEARLHLIHDHNATAHPILRFIVPFWFLTVKAQKDSPTAPPRHTRN